MFVVLCTIALSFFAGVASSATVEDQIDDIWQDRMRLLMQIGDADRKISELKDNETIWLANFLDKKGKRLRDPCTCWTRTDASGLNPLEPLMLERRRIKEKIRTSWLDPLWIAIDKRYTAATKDFHAKMDQKIRADDEYPTLGSYSIFDFDTFLARVKKKKEKAKKIEAEIAAATAMRAKWQTELEMQNAELEDLCDLVRTHPVCDTFRRERGASN